MSAKHTPGPWRTSSEHPCILKQDSGCDEVVGESRELLGSMHRAEDAAYVVQCVNAHDKMVLALRSAHALLERCSPHLHGVGQECCGQYEAGYGGEYMGQYEVVPVCCDHPIDLSDCVANELGVIDSAIAYATGASS